MTNHFFCGWSFLLIMVKKNMDFKIVEYISDELKRYVTLDRFSPVEKLVYGFAALVLTAVAVLLVNTVLK